jgi:hypothetical protein
LRIKRAYVPVLIISPKNIVYKSTVSSKISFEDHLM